MSMPEQDRPVIFASDFHLSGSDPEGVEIFSAFLHAEVEGAAAFFVLGDLFDIWIGPSQLADPGLQPVFNGLRSLISQGTRVTLLHGNRDYLLGRSESVRLGVKIPGESLQTTVQGRRLFLTHGDIFCTRDRAYQRMKKVLRSPLMRSVARILPSRATFALAQKLRMRSSDAVSSKSQMVTSIDLEAVESLVKTTGVEDVICGHVHNSAEHELTGGRRLLVLSEWQGPAGVFAVAREGIVSLRTYQGAQTQPRA